MSSSRHRSTRGRSASPPDDDYRRPDSTSRRSPGSPQAYAGGGGGGSSNRYDDARDRDDRYASRSAQPPPPRERDRYDDRDDRYNDDRYTAGGRYNPRDRSPPDDYRRSGASRDYDDRPRAPKKPVIRGSDEDRRGTTQLFLGNIPYHYTPRDVGDLVERYGPVEDITVPMDRVTGKNKGFCFVQFRDRRDAEDFYDDMSHDGTVDGRRVKIDWDIGKSKKGIENPPRRDDRGGGGERDRGARDNDRERERDRGTKDYDRDYAGDGYGRSAPSGSRGGR